MPVILCLWTLSSPQEAPKTKIGLWSAGILNEKVTFVYISSVEICRKIILLSARFGWSFLEKYPPTSGSTGNREITPFGPLLWQAKADTDLTLSASPQGVKSLGQNHGRCVWSDGENICWAAMLDVTPSIKVANSSWWVSSCLLGYKY